MLRTDSGVAARIFTGQYTGDGSVSLAITGIGFRPKYVRIINREPVAGTAVEEHIKTDQDPANFDTRHAGADISADDDHIRSLDEDGFTVDDNGANAHPNELNQVYSFVAIGD